MHHNNKRASLSWGVVRNRNCAKHLIALSSLVSWPKMLDIIFHIRNCCLECSSNSPKRTDLSSNKTGIQPCLSGTERKHQCTSHSAHPPSEVPAGKRTSDILPLGLVNLPYDEVYKSDLILKNPHEGKHRMTTRSSIYIAKYICKKIVNRGWKRYIYTTVIVAPYPTVKRWNQCKHPSTDVKQNVAYTYNKRLVNLQEESILKHDTTLC